MKAPHMLVIAAFCLLLASIQADEPASRVELLAKQREGAAKLADEQDELAADVQQLVIEQTNPQVIEPRRRSRPPEAAASPAAR